MALRSLNQWLGLYSESHRHPTNKQLHWICVPPIVWTVVALLYAIPAPVPGLWAWLAMLPAFVWYARLSLPLSIGLGLFFLSLILLSGLLYQILGPAKLAISAAVVFVLAWVGQFIGHHYEGRKPSFFNDLAFLLIGPAWLMAHLYRRAGLRY
jgi:uncharacterized membrane protein YGL010W